jgi:AraC family transcriptional activator of pobA
MYFCPQPQQSIVKMPVSPAIFDIGPLAGSATAKRPGKPGSTHDNIFSIIWLISGKGNCRVEKLVYGISDNQLICLGPGKEYSLEVSPGAEGFIIRFTGEFLAASEQVIEPQYQDDLYRLFSSPVALAVKKEMVEEMKGVAVRMVTESENVFLYKSQILRRYLKIFLIYLSRHNNRKEEPMIYTRSAQLVQKFMFMLEKEYKTVKSVNEYASQLSVTPNHLNVIVKKHTRHPAGYHIRQRIILEAKRLAIYSDVCMKEIAYLLGFSDTAHFSKFFKKSTGVNFSAFKRSQEPEMLMG